MSLIRSMFPEISRDLQRAFRTLEDPFMDMATHGRRGRNFLSPFAALPSLPSLAEQMGFKAPIVDLAETDKSYIIEAELPGIKKEDIDIEVLDDSTVVLKGKVESSREYGQPPSSTVQSTSDVGDSSSGGGEVMKAEDKSKAVETSKEQDKTFWTQERVFGKFQRVFSFPMKVDPNQIKATYKNGILSISVPKPEVTNRAKVKIESTEEVDQNVSPSAV
ncbi:HSP20-like chaperone [Paraphysoderma sedebokerense]|nr:HSP20-like chaperone [Paraphysoderma sedebokerense]